MSEAKKSILSTAGGKWGILTCVLAVITAIVFPMMAPSHTATIFMTVSVMLMCVTGIVTVVMLMMDEMATSIWVILGAPPLAQLYFAFLLTYM